VECDIGDVDVCSVSWCVQLYCRIRKPFRGVCAAVVDCRGCRCTAVGMH
jgi:hypothetical protein